MKKELRKCFLLGFIFVCFSGTLFHFLYKWTGSHRIVGLFCPVNESVWEHMKLFFFPMLLFTVIMSYFNLLQTRYSTLIPALLIGLHFGTCFIPICFYTYSGVLGYHIPWIDISIFYLAVFLSLRSAYGKIKNSRISKYEIPLKISAMILFLLFLIFTYAPPDIALFLSAE